MILALHRLRKDEEGQTLVLAAIFGLILALCVLGTVNVGRAVYDKMQLQTAADSAAYSQAAVGARVMNFTAYTNRAMVVHYASIMAMSAYLTYFHFLWGMARGAFKLASYIPYIGPIFKAIEQVLTVLLQVLDVVVFALTPVIAAANVVLYGLQEGAWYSFAKRLATLPPEAHSGDTGRRPYQTLGFGWNALMTAANQASWAQVRGSSLMPKNSLDTFKILYNAKDDNVQLARMHMVEIANSARQPWVAYGDKANQLSLVPGARHWWWGTQKVGFGVVSRTEMGSPTPAGILGSITRGSGQVWSANRLEFALKLHFIVSIDLKLKVFTTVTMDQFYTGPGGLAPRKDWYNLGYSTDAKGFVSRILGKLLNFLSLGALPAAGAIMKKEGDALFKKSDSFKHRFFWISPYVSFSPRGSAKAGVGPLGKPGNFNQPDFVVGLNKPATDYNNELGASRIFGRKFVSRIGGKQGQGSTDFRMSTAKTLPTLPPGMNTFAAAQVYYHRPGDWKEMPNLFNPLWGARLMPVLESNGAAKLLLANNALFRQFILH